jgi:hypothetical protein
MHDNELTGAPVRIKLRTRMLLILQYKLAKRDAGVAAAGGLVARLHCRAGFAASLWKSFGLP